MQKPITLVWFRRNLRVADNAALAVAAARGGAAVGVYVAEASDDAPRFDAFAAAALRPLQADLAAAGVDLQLLGGDAATEIAALARRCSADKVVADEGYMPSEITRDNQVWRLLDAQGVAFERVNDRALFAKAQIMDEHGAPYTDFAAYRQAWLAGFAHWQMPSETRLPGFQTASAAVGHALLPPRPDAPWLPEAGERAAWRQWQIFADDADSYPLLKDFPAKKAVSRMSVYLAAGCVSVRQLAESARKHGWHDWLNQLIKRDFYQQLLYHRPGVLQQPLASLRQMPLSDADLLARWQHGQTGFPLVDAAMRCLNGSGWLHPRLREAAAECLCGILRQPWQDGVAWFARQSADYDPALNAGNWLAAAGWLSAKPQRAAHPLLLAQQLDPDGTFIRRYVPELAHLPKDVIHAPWLAASAINSHGYPPPPSDWQARRG